MWIQTPLGNYISNDRHYIDARKGSLEQFYEAIDDDFVSFDLVVGGELILPRNLLQNSLFVFVEDNHPLPKNKLSRATAKPTNDAQ